MSVDTGAGPGRYRAFISYSHKDAAFGRHLHRRLEAYVLPRRMVGRAGADGIAVPGRLAPIFRDREEFSAAQDLSAQVRAALAQSRSLVVVCSAAAAQSVWVAREVELFRELHPDRPVLAAIRAGEPPDCLPPVLRQRTASGEFIEPLAADFRKGRDGWEHGILKLVAGIVGVGLDELVQRDLQRRVRRVTAVTAAALALVLVMGVLTVFALSARSEAERQRGEAEGLVEFMLTDLRTTLKGVGRLDAMTAVNERALKYYTDQDLSRLPPDSLERRARTLHAMGEDDETRGDRNAALKNFQEAERTTGALLAAAPNDPERLFDHTQSEYWIGLHNYMQKNFAAAKPYFLAYKQLVDRMIAIAPENPKYMRELGYAEGDLCSLAIQPPRDGLAALRLCKAALAQMEAVARHAHWSAEAMSDVANRHGWLADAYLANDDREHAIAERRAQDRIMRRLMAADPLNMDLKSDWIALQRVLARIEAKSGERDAALARLGQALSTIDEMVGFDRNNKVWPVVKSKLNADKATISSQPPERIEL
ncbi:MAG: toll/interleukin-1 receptor domain-containing protein [Rhizomicrobium sp.]